MQGRCPTPPSEQKLGIRSVEVPLRDLKPMQCVIIVNSEFLKTGSSPMWVDNLYIRHVASSDRIIATSVQVTAGSPLWMTGITFQGTGDSEQECVACALSVLPGAKALCQGVSPSNFSLVECMLTSTLLFDKCVVAAPSSGDPDSITCRADCMVTDFHANTVTEMWRSSSLALRQCSLINNRVFSGESIGAILVARNSSATYEGGIMVENTTVVNSTAPYELIIVEGTGNMSPALFSDASDVAVCTYRPGCELCYYRRPSCQTLSPQTLQDAPDGVFLSLEDAALRSIQQVRCHGLIIACSRYVVALTNYIPSLVSLCRPLKASPDSLIV